MQILSYVDFKFQIVSKLPVRCIVVVIVMTGRIVLVVLSVRTVAERWVSSVSGQCMSTGMSTQDNTLLLYLMCKLLTAVRIPRIYLRKFNLLFHVVFYSQS